MPRATKKRAGAADADAGDQTTGRAAEESAGATGAEESQGEQTAGAPRPAEFDAGARQRWPMLIAADDGPLVVAFIYDPHAPGPHGTFDRALREYVRRRSAVPATTTPEEADEARALAQLDAAAWLFDSFVVDVEGVGAEGEEKPRDWQSYFTPQEKNRTLFENLFDVASLDAEGSPAARSWSALAVSSFRLRAPFDGGRVDTRHTLRKGDTAALRAHGWLLELMADVTASSAVEMVLHFAPEYAALYDRLKVSAGGYAGGVVPVHHKAFAAFAHLSTQARAVRKN